MSCEDQIAFAKTTPQFRIKSHALILLSNHPKGDPSQHWRSMIRYFTTRKPGTFSSCSMALASLGCPAGQSIGRAFLRHLVALTKLFCIAIPVAAGHARTLLRARLSKSPAGTEQ